MPEGSLFVCFFLIICFVCVPRSQYCSTPAQPLSCSLPSVSLFTQKVLKKKQQPT